jgi:hypothetical protein
MPRFGNGPFLTTTLPFLSSRGQPLFPCNDPFLVVIPSEASGSAVRHSCAPLLPGPQPPQSSPNPHGNTNLPFVIPGFQEWSADPFAPPDFLLRWVALANFTRLSLRERRTRNRDQRSLAGIRVGMTRKGQRVHKEWLLNRGISNPIWTTLTELDPELLKQTP